MGARRALAQGVANIEVLLLCCFAKRCLLELGAQKEVSQPFAQDSEIFELNDIATKGDCAFQAACVPHQVLAKPLDGAQLIADKIQVCGQMVAHDLIALARTRCVAIVV